MREKDYTQDITEIKSVTNKPNLSISLSGLSGILAGVYALIGAFVGNYLINAYQTQDSTIALLPISFFEVVLVGLATMVLILSVITAYVLTRKKIKEHKEKIWTTTSIKLLQNFSLPLITGGFFSIVLYQYNLIGLIAPCTLIFYGLACVNASKLTFGAIYYLGISNVILGLISTQFTSFSFYFWALGFGIFHIIYGSLTYKKHEP